MNGSNRNYGYIVNLFKIDDIDVEPDTHYFDNYDDAIGFTCECKDSEEFAFVSDPICEEEK